ncbi:hypothetical protein T439DRAFT_383113 [Meredithblackwellia eburnea MCA 4105]
MNRCSRCQISNYCSETCQKGDWRLHKAMCSLLKTTVVLTQNPLPTPSVNPPPFWDSYYVDPLSNGPETRAEHVASNKLLQIMAAPFQHTVEAQIFSSLEPYLLTAQETFGSGKLAVVHLEFVTNHPRGTYTLGKTFTLERVHFDGIVGRDRASLTHADGRYARTKEMYNTPGPNPQFLRTFQRREDQARQKGKNNITVCLIYRFVYEDRLRDLTSDFTVVSYKDFATASLTKEDDTDPQLFEFDMMYRFGPTQGSGLGGKRMYPPMQLEAEKMMYHMRSDDEVVRLRVEQAIMASQPSIMTQIEKDGGFDLDDLTEPAQLAVYEALFPGPPSS